MPRTKTRTSLTEAERDELHAWLTAEKINPSRIRREFADVKPTATLLSKYYPELVDVNFYPPRNSVNSKMSNWEQFNKRVLTKLGVKLTRQDMEQVSRSIPGSIDLLLYKIMKLHNVQRRLTEVESGESVQEDVEEPASKKPSVILAETTSAAAVLDENKSVKTSPALSKVQSIASDRNKSTHSTIRSGSTEAAITAPIKSSLTPAGGTEGGAVTRKGIEFETSPKKLLTGMENRNFNFNTKKAFVLKQSPKDGFVVVSLPMKIGDKMRAVTKKLIPINSFNKAVSASRRKDAKIEQFSQKLAHLENLISLKKEHIGELRSKIQNSYQNSSGIIEHDDDPVTCIPSPPTIMSKLSKMNPVVRFNVNVGDDRITKRKKGGASTLTKQRTTTTPVMTPPKKKSSTVRYSKQLPIEEPDADYAGLYEKSTRIKVNANGRKQDWEIPELGTYKTPGMPTRRIYRKLIHHPSSRPRSICITTNNKYAWNSRHEENQ